MGGTDEYFALRAQHSVDDMRGEEGMREEGWERLTDISHCVLNTVLMT